MDKLVNWFNLLPPYLWTWHRLIKINDDKNEWRKKHVGSRTTCGRQELVAVAVAVISLSNKKALKTCCSLPKH